MLLNDIGKSPTTTFKKINQHLEANFGFKISEDASDKDLVMIMEQLEEEITDLKLRGDDARSSAEITKRLLVLEGVKSLRENALMQLQSPKLESVVNGLCEFVVDTFGISGMCDQDYEDAVKRAMDEYRSSRYRFPDDYIESRVREMSMNRIRESGCQAPSMEEGWDLVGKRAGSHGGYTMSAKDDSEVDRILSKNPKLAAASLLDIEKTPTTIDARGREVVDPFEKHKADRLKGITMKESLVKNLRVLLETEVSQAEVMMASKGFAQELQEMIEKIGRLQNEDLPPVTDQMRETYGTDSASAFQTQIYGALQSVMNALYTAKGQVDDAVTNMAETGTFSAGIDMEKDISADVDGIDDEVTSMDVDLDNISDDEVEDDFGAADVEEPLGRAKKTEESTEALKQKVEEMKKLVAKAKKLKESKRK